MAPDSFEPEELSVLGKTPSPEIPLTQDELEAMRSLMVFAAGAPEAFPTIHEAVTLFFSERPMAKLKVWHMLSRDERYTYKEKLVSYTPETRELIKELQQAKTKSDVCFAYAKYTNKDHQRAEYFMSFRERICVAKLLLD